MCISTYLHILLKTINVVLTLTHYIVHPTQIYTNDCVYVCVSTYNDCRRASSIWQIFRTPDDATCHVCRVRHITHAHKYGVYWFSCHQIKNLAPQAHYLCFYIPNAALLSIIPDLRAWWRYRRHRLLLLHCLLLPSSAHHTITHSTTIILNIHFLW